MARNRRQRLRQVVEVNDGDGPLDEGFQNYGSALEDVRRGGTVRHRSLLVAGTALAIAMLVGVLALVQRDGKGHSPPADVEVAGTEIRDAFASWFGSAPRFEELTAGDARRRADAQWAAVAARFPDGTARSGRIEFVDAETAFVDFHIIYSPSTGSVLSTRSTAGRAVLQDGEWRIGYASACALATEVERFCNPADFLTDEEQAIGQPFVDVSWSRLSDDERVHNVERGNEIRNQILGPLERFRGSLGAKGQLLAVRHHPGERTAKVWWTVGSVQPALAVYDHDHWTISRETWCEQALGVGEFPPACGTAPTTTTTLPGAVRPIPTVEPFTYETSGPLVRGSSIRLTLHGLDRLAGHRVHLAFSDGLPEEQLYNSNDAAGGMTGGIVDDHGSLVTEAVVPNRLATNDGSHEYPLVETNKTYDFFVVLEDYSTIWYRATVRIDAADPGTPYPATVSNNKSSTDCGAPPFEAVFDGRNWTPDDTSAFAADQDTFDGTITLLSGSTARFTFEDGQEVGISESPAWFC